MRQGLAVAIAASCLLGWSASMEVRAGEATECRPEEPAICDEEFDREEVVIYPEEFIEAPKAVFRFRCRYEYWRAVLVGLGPFYPELCPKALEWDAGTGGMYR